MPGVGTADGRADARDLVLHLQRHHAEVLQLGQVLQDVGGRCDGVGAQQDLQPRQLGSGDQAEGQGFVAHDVAVGARSDVGLGRHFVAALEDLVDVAGVVAGAQGRLIGHDQVGLALELFGEPLEGRLQGTAVQPVPSAQGVEVLAAEHVLLAQGRIRQRPCDAIVDVDLDHPVAGERAVVQRVRVELGLGQVALAEAAGVDDDDAAGFRSL